MKSYKLINGNYYFDYRFLYRSVPTDLGGFDVRKLSDSTFKCDRKKFMVLDSDRVVYDDGGILVTATGSKHIMYRAYSDERIEDIYERVMDIIRVVEALNEF